MNDQKLGLLGNSRGTAILETHAIQATGKSTEGLGWAAFLAGSAKKEKSSQNASSKFTGRGWGEILGGY